MVSGEQKQAVISLFDKGVDIGEIANKTRLHQSTCQTIIDEQLAIRAYAEDEDYVPSAKQHDGVSDIKMPEDEPVVNAPPDENDTTFVSPSYEAIVAKETTIEPEPEERKRGRPSVYTSEDGRVCNRCGNDKPLDEFVKNKSRPGGFMNTCKVCYSAEMREKRRALGAKPRNPKERENGAKIAPKPQKISKPKQEGNDMTKENENNGDIACVILRNVNADYFAALMQELQNGDGGDNVTCEIVFNEAEE